MGIVAIDDRERVTVLTDIESAFVDAGLALYREDRAPELTAGTEGSSGVLRGGTVTVIGGDADGAHLEAKATARADGTTLIAVTGRTDCLR